MPGTIGRSGGGNRKSSRRKALSSTLRRDRARSDAGEAARPERPDWLADRIAIAAWDRICALLEARDTLSEGDADAILLASVAEAEYRAADALIVAEGLVVDGKQGLVAHPAVKVRSDAWKRWASALSRLGLDPITRSRVDRAPRMPGDNTFGAI